MNHGSFSSISVHGGPAEQGEEALFENSTHSTGFGVVIKGDACAVQWYVQLSIDFSRKLSDELMTVPGKHIWRQKWDLKGVILK